MDGALSAVSLQPSQLCPHGAGLSREHCPHCLGTVLEPALQFAVLPVSLLSTLLRAQQPHHPRDGVPTPEPGTLGCISVLPESHGFSTATTGKKE